MTADQEIELAALLVQAQEGDSAAYREFLVRAATHVRHWVGRRLSSTETVEEIVQEVLISLHSARHTYEPGKPVVPWMRAITQRRVYDYLRRWMKHSGHKLVRPMVEADSHRHSTAEEATSGMALREAVAGLSSQQREVFELVKREGLSTKEVSQRLNLSEASVRVVAHRAYEKIKQYLMVDEYENR